MNNTPYPFQICSYINNSQTFAITESLQVATGVNETGNGRKPIPPLETPGYSIFRAALLSDENGQKKILTANIPEDDVINIYDDSKIAKRIKLKNAAGANGSTQEVRFATGTYKGKTPSEVLAMPNGAEILNKTKEFLSKNLDK